MASDLEKGAFFYEPRDDPRFRTAVGMGPIIWPEGLIDALGGTDAMETLESTLAEPGAQDKLTALNVLLRGSSSDQA